MLLIKIASLLCITVTYPQYANTNSTNSSRFMELRVQESGKYDLSRIFHGISSVQCSLRCLRNIEICQFMAKIKTSSSDLISCELLLGGKRLKKSKEHKEKNNRRKELLLSPTTIEPIDGCARYKDGPPFVSFIDPGIVISGVEVNIDCNSTRDSVSENSTLIQVGDKAITSVYKPEDRDNGKILKCTTSFNGCVQSKTVPLTVKSWTILQRRVDGDVGFDVGWEMYKNGFGNTNGSFWFGLEKAHKLMKNKDITLRFDLWDGESYYWAEYSTVTISDESKNYRLDYIGFTGSTVDAMTKSKNRMFTTKDRDNDAASWNCAVQWSGGWWHGACFDANLNGIFGSTSMSVGINWKSITGFERSLSKTEMRFISFD